VSANITVYLNDQPGELARLAKALATHGVNLGGVCAVTNGGGMAEVNVLVDELAPALEALEDAGIEIGTEQEVIVVDLEDRPGALAEITQRLAEGEINLNLVYLATGTRLVLAPEPFETAIAALRRD
jgi:hypothetical protein